MTMLLPPAMRDQDPQPSQPFGERKPRPEELEAQRRAAEVAAKAKPRSSTNLPMPPKHINDHEMIRRDLGDGALVKFSAETVLREEVWKSGPPTVGGWYIVSNSGLEHFARHWWAKEHRWSLAENLNDEVQVANAYERSACRMAKHTSLGVKWLRPVVLP